MKCDICGERDAIFTITHVIGSERKELHLCAECAKEANIPLNEQKIGNSVRNLLYSLIDKKHKSMDDNKICPVCGQSLSTIKKTRRVGCAECYTAFKTEIKTIFNEKNITMEYSGTLPKQLKCFHSVLSDRMMLNAKLKEAVENEEYEKAAVYRDQLKILESNAVDSSMDYYSDLQKKKTESDKND